MEKHIFADLQECRACLSCENACRAEHFTSPDPLAAFREGAVARIRVQSHDGSPVPLACRHCDEPACVDACMSGAMALEPENSRVTLDEDRCVGCAMCVMACPFGVVALEQANGRRIALKCDLCPERDTPACVEACPQAALLYCSAEELDEDKQARLIASAPA